MNLRPAGEADAAGLAQVHVAAWLETYPGLVPDSFLAKLSVAERTKRWTQILSEPATPLGTKVFLAEEVGDRLVGFASCGPQRTPELASAGFAAEFMAIYVLRSAQRRGIGHRLMQMMATDLVGRGLDGASVWVLRANLPARSFYEKLGGTVVLTSDAWKEGETVLHEVAYGWPRLTDVFGEGGSGGPR